MDPEAVRLSPEILAPLDFLCEQGRVITRQVLISSCRLQNCHQFLTPIRRLTRAPRVPFELPEDLLVGRIDYFLFRSLDRRSDLRTG